MEFLFNYLLQIFAAENFPNLTIYSRNWEFPQYIVIWYF